MQINPIEALQNQLLDDMEQFADLMNRQAAGDPKLQAARDQLEGAVEIKLAILEGLKRQQEDGELLLMEEDYEEDEEW